MNLKEYQILPKYFQGKYNNPKRPSTDDPYPNRPTYADRDRKERIHFLFPNKVNQS